ncbi:MAG: zinc ABC transporter substrate-binding protein [Alphaproteobacteria bacterium]|nr:zinc ABC transporter substrate-binding protein [Alphaproteobacteria bacterium]
MRADVSRRTLLLAALGAAATAPVAAAKPGAPPRGAVASFSVLADITRAIAGADLPVRALAGAGVDPHGFEPRPADAAALTGASALVVNGLGFDPWATRLAKATRFAGLTIVASARVTPIGQGRTLDPHAWLDVANARAYAHAIADGLATARPDLAPGLRARAAAYDAALAALDAELRAAFAAIPPARRVLVTAHDSFAYFGRAYGFRLVPMRSAAGEDDAARTAAAIRTVRAVGAVAAFPERTLDPRGVARLREETGVRVGGALFTDALSEATGPASSYIGLMRTNARTITAALT